MHIGLSTLKGIFFGIGIFLLDPLCAQHQEQPDTIQSKFMEMFWTRERLVPKIGVSVQERAFIEVGVYWHNIYRHPLSLASKGPYATIDIMVDDENLLIGPKAGYEFTAGMFGAAFDVTYYYDKDYNSEGLDRRAFVATPKAGLTLLGFLDLFYGYQIPLSETVITSLSRHRFSLTFNLNKDYFNVKSAPRKD
jgi:hypothetical protein